MIGPVIILSGFVMLVCGISICALSWKLANEDRRNSMFGERRGVGENNNTFQYYYGGNDRCTSQVYKMPFIELNTVIMQLNKCVYISYI